jgi:SAM-dependent methyltransferase
VIDGLRGATALELACGTGRDAVYLASRGWRVVGVDWLADALERAAGLAERCAAAIEPIEWRAIDLEAADVRIGQKFDLITCFRFLHRPLIPRLGEWLTPGGVVVYETFTTVHRERYGKPGSDAHVLRAAELAELFAGYSIEHVSEGWRGTAHTGRLVARGRPSAST